MSYPVRLPNAIIPRMTRPVGFSWAPGVLGSEALISRKDISDRDIYQAPHEAGLAARRPAARTAADAILRASRLRVQHARVRDRRELCEQRRIRRDPRDRSGPAAAARPASQARLQGPRGGGAG